MPRKPFFNWVRQRARKGTKIEEGSWSKKSRLTEKKGASTLDLDVTIGDSVDISEVLKAVKRTVNRKSNTDVQRFDIHFRNGGDKSGEEFERSILEAFEAMVKKRQLKDFYVSGHDATVNMIVHSRQRPGWQFIR